MERRAFAVTPIHPIKDKRARLRVAARYIKTGVVKFPRTAVSGYSPSFRIRKSTTTRWTHWYIWCED
jgi:hypothetical protein